MPSPIISLATRRWLLLAALLGVPGQIVAQASCDIELNEDQRFRRSLCDAHLGCRLVTAIFDSCRSATRWINALPGGAGRTSLSDGEVLAAIDRLSPGDLPQSEGMPNRSDCWFTSFSLRRCRQYIGLEPVDIPKPPEQPAPPPEPSPDVRVRASTLELYQQAQSARNNGGPHGDAQRALDWCGRSIATPGQDAACRAAIPVVEQCVAFKNDWEARRSALIAEIDTRWPGIGQEYSRPVTVPKDDGTSRQEGNLLRGIGQQPTNEERWSDAVRGLRTLEMRACPGFATGTWRTPQQILAGAVTTDDSLKPGVIRGLPRREASTGTKLVEGSVGATDPKAPSMTPRQRDAQGVTVGPTFLDRLAGAAVEVHAWAEREGAVAAAEADAANARALAAQAALAAQVEADRQARAAARPAQEERPAAPAPDRFVHGTGRDATHCLQKGEERYVNTCGERIEVLSCETDGSICTTAVGQWTYGPGRTTIPTYRPYLVRACFGANTMHSGSRRGEPLRYHCDAPR